MTNRLQHWGWIARIRLRTTRAALGLAVAFVPMGVNPSAQAQTLTVLYSFTGGADGKLPRGVVRDASGNLYVSPYKGGKADNGTMVKLARTGKERTLYNFGLFPDASNPVGTLALDKAGNIYGATQNGGVPTAGTVYKLDKAGKEPSYTASMILLTDMPPAQA